MTEYIDREQLELDTEWSEYDDGFTAYSQGQIQRATPADVVERAEYEELNDRYLKAIHNHTECLKELHELRSKIDKAIEELQHIKVYERTATARLVSLPEVLDVLKRI